MAQETVANAKTADAKTAGSFGNTTIHAKVDPERRCTARRGASECDAAGAQKNRDRYTMHTGRGGCLSSVAGAPR
jgi:hypothetical protein